MAIDSEDRPAVVPLSYRTPIERRVTRRSTLSVLAFLPLGVALGGIATLVTWYPRHRYPLTREAMVSVLYWTLGLDMVVTWMMLRLLVAARRRVGRAVLHGSPIWLCLVVGGAMGWVRWTAPQFWPRLADRTDLQPMWLLAAPVAFAVIAAVTLIRSGPQEQR